MTEGKDFGQGKTAVLRLLWTSDLHFQILAYDYEADRPASGRGLALVAAEAARASGEVDNAIWLDGGDVFEGGPVDAEVARGTIVHPMPEALAAAGVAAGTLGNHDFDHGLVALESLIAASRIPLTLCNIVRDLGGTPLEDTPFLPPYVLLDRELTCDDGARRGVTLGLVGVAPPQTLAWNNSRIGDALVARDIVEAVEAHAGAARRAGADLIIVLCHSGIGDANPEPGAENAAVPVAALPGVDVVLAGHSHLLFPDQEFPIQASATGIVDPLRGLLHGKPAVMPGFWGQSLGQIDLTLAAPSSSGEPWGVAQSASRLRTVGDVDAAHEPVERVAAPYHQAVRAAMNDVIGPSEHRLSTQFALVHDCAAVRLIHAAQLAVGSSLLSGSAKASLPLLSATAPLRTGGRHGPEHYTDIPPGAFRRRHLSALYGYANTVEVVEISGNGLSHWLERSASVFETVSAGRGTQPLLDPAHPGYQFDMISGVSCRIDLRHPPAFDAAGHRLYEGGRVADLRWQGMEVEPEQRFALVTSSYRVGGGFGFPSFAEADRLVRSDVVTRDALSAYIASGGAQEALPARSWGFVSIPGARARFATGPAALKAAPVALGPDSALARLGAQPDGFDLWEIDMERAGDLA